VKLSP